MPTPTPSPTPTFAQTPPPGSQEPAAPQARRLYRGRTLAALSVIDLLGFLLMFADPSLWNSDTTQAASGNAGPLGTIGIGVVIVVTIAVAICDWRGFTSLHGAIKWGRMKLWQQLLLGYFFVGLSMFLVPVYLIQAFNTYRQATHAEPLQQRLHVARMEADLGIMPATEGTCPSCGKPMQVGAEFCVYCGKTLVAKPKVCGACGATALPDAQWCPQCRARLVDGI
ncbi:MAG TPA: zinc ribbon domain-containing protein [Ktedonobacterales bacterium]|nr:zinc ribbon domain-containing protein [Ktedonobacterales bacterium]